MEQPKEMNKKEYNHILLYEKEAEALESLDKVIGEPIPHLSAGLKTREKFGFFANQGHVIGW
jgi:hypothetical protein